MERWQRAMKEGREAQAPQKRVGVAAGWQRARWASRRRGERRSGCLDLGWALLGSHRPRGIAIWGFPGLESWPPRAARPLGSVGGRGAAEREGRGGWLLTSLVRWGRAWWAQDEDRAVGTRGPHRPCSAHRERRSQPPSPPGRKMSLGCRPRTSPPPTPLHPTPSLCVCVCLSALSLLSSCCSSPHTRAQAHGHTHMHFFFF